MKEYYKMRNERQMYNMILNIAEKDDRIRAVYMNGSRADPNIKKDTFQDYDIVYVVEETKSFLKDTKFLKAFGDILILQEPDRLDKGLDLDIDFDRSYTYLMLFEDFNRLDLHIQTKEAMLEVYTKDSLTVPLMDKDNCLPEIPPSNDSDYHVKRPTESAFESYTNNFWWCLQNVAKGICRDQLPYAKEMFDRVIRGCLNNIISWWIGMNHDFKVTIGAMNKHFKKYLPENYWNMYSKTYCDSNYSNMWESIFTACELFRKLGKEVAKEFNFVYPQNDDDNMIYYLKSVKKFSEN